MSMMDNGRAASIGKIARIATRAILYIVLALFYMSAAAHLGLGVNDGGPDETMRMLLPQAIASGNLFPSGFDQEVVYGLGNWSYAFYPQVLGAYASAFFMVIARILGGVNAQLIVAGRMASICFGLMTLTFVSRTVRVVVKSVSNENAAFCFEMVTLVLLGFWPQFAFLSSYMNNDIVALCGVAIIIHALVLGIGSKWTMPRSILFAIGVVVVGLGYWNACVFAATGIPLFIVTVMRQSGSIKKKLAMIGAAAMLAAVCILPFYILNIIRYGDMFGMTIFHERYLEWLANGGEVLQHPHVEGIKSLLLRTSFVFDTVDSFVGRLGYMTVCMPFLLCLMYLVIALLGCGGFIARARLFITNGNRLAFLLCCMLSCGLVVLLSIYYSVHTDYQPQGRYVIYLLVPLMIAACIGLFCQITQVNGTSKVLFASHLSPASLILLLIILFAYSAATVWFFASSAAAYGWCGP